MSKSKKAPRSPNAPRAEFQSHVRLQAFGKAAACADALVAALDAAHAVCPPAPGAAPPPWTAHDIIALVDRMRLRLAPPKE